MNEELKPLKDCPFCGSSAVIEDHMVDNCFVIKCISCDCKMPQGCYGNAFKEEAVEEWNKRA